MPPVQADKRYQLCDWRIRPLSLDMVQYARTDTHYLLYIYDRLKQLLQEAGDEVGMGRDREGRRSGGQRLREWVGGLREWLKERVSSRRGRKD